MALTVLLLCTTSSYQRPVLDIAHKNIGKEIAKTYSISSFELKDVQGSAQTANPSHLFKAIIHNGMLTGYAYLGRVNSCRAGGCSIDRNASDDDQTAEYFDYLALFDPNGAIKQVKVVNYQASHGQEIANKGWLKQFIGFDGANELVVGRHIDAVSGATISVYAITHDVNQAASTLKSLISLAKH